MNHQLPLNLMPAMALGTMDKDEDESWKDFPTHFHINDQCRCPHAFPVKINLHSQICGDGWQSGMRSPQFPIFQMRIDHLSAWSPPQRYLDIDCEQSHSYRMMAGLRLMSAKKKKESSLNF